MLVRYIRALCPQQAIDEFTPDAWHDVLADLEFGAARHAAMRIAHRQPFIAPSEIVAEASKREVRKPYECTPAEAIAASSLRALPAAEAVPAPPEFSAAVLDLKRKLAEKAEKAMAVDRASERRATAWLDYKLTGKLPPDLPPPGSPAPPRWVPLPGDPPELREWLIRKAGAEGPDSA